MDTITNLWRAQKTVLEMLDDRGYTLENEHICYWTIDEFKIKYHTDNIDLHIINDEREVYVKFFTVYKVKPNVIRDFISKTALTFTKEDNKIIIVLLSKPNNTVLKIRNEAYKNIEFFWANRLIINITQHQYVPLHEKISCDTIPEIIKKYNLSTIRQLPLLDKNDPISRYYDFKSGDVCKITRKNKISGISIIYRLVK